MAKSRTTTTNAIPPTERSPRESEAAPQPVGDTTAAAPEPDRVAMRAYEIYQARGASDGQALEDWLAAERELNARSTRNDQRRGD